MGYIFLESPRSTEQQELDDSLAAIQEKISKIIDAGVNRRLENIEKHLSDVQNRAKKLANQHGMTDTDKQWLIDQLLRLILGESEYAVWFRRFDVRALENGTPRWDFGKAPE